MASNALKYKFTVLYKDDSIYQQNERDVSTIDPSRSCFTDAVYKSENGKFLLDEQGNMTSRMDEIYRFLVQLSNGPEPERHSYMVDLTTGHFEVNCIPFRFHDSDQQFTNRKLIFFRRHYHKITIGVAQEDEDAHRIAFRLGWEGTLPSGEVKSFVMEVD